MELPILFEKRMKALLGAEYEDFAHALRCEEAVKGLRVNLHKVSVNEFEQNAPFPLEPLPYGKGCYIVSEEVHAGKHPYHHAGAYYMQDPGAMATVEALPDAVWQNRDLKILDLCAAPGGKTTQLAALCEPQGGMVLANEYNTARSRILAGNVERMGLPNVCVTNLDSRHLADWYPEWFDLVVVDAPCSGEGMYRKNDLAISEWSPENVQACAKRQREILENGACCLAPGGYLVYSTCTYATEENEEIVAAFLESHPTFHLCACHPDVVARTADGVDISHGRIPQLAFCRRFYPHMSKGEGQFVALLRREESDGTAKCPVKDAAVPLTKTDRAVAERFLTEALGQTPSDLFWCGNLVSSFAAGKGLGFPLPPFGVVSVGVTLGELRKGRMIPHHNFFTVYGGAVATRLILEAQSEEVARYLAGEELSVPSEWNGSTGVLLRLGNGFVTLGGGKASSGRLKNYYPKGLRVR